MGYRSVAINKINAVDVGRMHSKIVLGAFLGLDFLRKGSVFGAFYLVFLVFTVFNPILNTLCPYEDELTTVLHFLDNVVVARQVYRWADAGEIIKHNM